MSEQSNRRGDVRSSYRAFEKSPQKNGISNYLTQAVWRDLIIEPKEHLPREGVWGHEGEIIDEACQDVL